MKYIKQLLIFLVVGILGFVIFYALTEGLSYLFLFPLLFLSLFLGYYLYGQWQADESANMEKGIQYAIEDVEAEKWVKNIFAPHTLSTIKKKHWAVLLYSFLLISIASFTWSYLSFGLQIAIRNFSYGSFLFWVFVAYAFGAQSFFLLIYRMLPKKLQGFLSGDWERAYFFLFPISFVIYLLYPYDLIWKQLLTKISSFPLFLLVYTFVFLALYSLIYLVEDMQRDEEKHLQKEVEKLLRESEK
jgi:hypothetical protein